MRGLIAAVLLTVLAQVSLAQRPTRAVRHLQALYFPVVQNGLWGYIDTTGKIVHAPRYQQAGDFTNHIAIVKADGKYTVIDTLFRPVIAVRFDSVIHDRFFLRALSKGSWTFYHNNGKLANKSSYSHIRQLENEYGRGLLYKVWQNGKCGLLDTGLRETIPVKYDRVLPYAPDIFLAKNGSRFGLIRFKGQEIIPLQYDEISAHNDTVAQVRQGNKWGYITLSGKVIAQPMFDDIQLLDSWYFKGYNDTTFALYSVLSGKLVSNDYEDYFPLTKEYIAVRSKGLIGVISKDNVLKIKPAYQDVTTLGTRFFSAGDRGKYGVITIKGDTVVPIEYTAVKALSDIFGIPVYNGYFKVYQREKAGVCDSTGRLIIPVRFTDVIEYEKKLFRTEIALRYGLYNRKGTELLSARYDILEPGDNNVHVGRTGFCHAVATADTLVAGPLYDKVVIGTNTVKLYNGGLLEVVTITPAGKIEDRFTYDNIPSYNVSSPIPRPAFRTRPPLETEIYEWMLWQPTGKWGVRNKVTGKFEIEPKYDAISRTPYGSLFITEIRTGGFTAKIGDIKVVAQRLYGIVSLPDASESFPPAHLAVVMRNEWTGEAYSSAMDFLVDTSGTFRFSAADDLNAHGKITYIDKLHKTTRRFVTGGQLRSGSEEQGEAVEDVYGLYNRIGAAVPLSVGTENLDRLTNDSVKFYTGGEWNYIHVFLNEHNEVQTHVFPKLQYGEIAAFKETIAVNGSGKAGLIYSLNNGNADFRYAKISRSEKAINYYVAGKEDSLCGYIDNTGNIKINTEYNDARDFSEGLAPVMRDNKWTYVDTSGKELMPVSLEYAGPFNKGLALVMTDGLYGIIDKRGKFVIPAQHDTIAPFSNGYAMAQSRNKFYFFRRDGSLLDTPPLKKAGSFAHGYAAVRTAGGFGIMDSSGAITLLEEAKGIGAIGASLVVPVKMEKGFRLYDIRSRKMLTKAGFTKMGNESEELIAVKIENRFGYIDISGKLVIEAAFESAGDFMDGRALVRHKKKWGYIDRTGNYVVDPKFESISHYNDGAAIAVLDGKTQCIDHKGDVLFTADTFTIAAPFREGFAVAGTNGQAYYIDKSGKQVFGKMFDKAAPFENGFAQVVYRGYGRIIDTRGEFVYNERYASVGHAHNGLHYAKLGVLYGVVTGDFKTVVEHRYEAATPVTQQIIRVEKDDLTGYVNSKGRVIWPLQR